MPTRTGSRRVCRARTRRSSHQASAVTATATANSSQGSRSLFTYSSGMNCMNAAAHRAQAIPPARPAQRRAEQPEHTAGRARACDPGIPNFLGMDVR